MTQRLSWENSRNLSHHGIGKSIDLGGFLSFVVGLELRPPGSVDFTLAARVDPSNERRTLGRITATVNGDMRGI